MTDQKRKDELNAALDAAKRKPPFDEYGNYGENNGPLPKTKSGEKK